MAITFDVLDQFQENEIWQVMTHNELYSDLKYKIVACYHGNRNILN